MCLGLPLWRPGNVPSAGVMKKCTLCVDRIYNENIPEEDRVPACVRSCPTNARFFGDLADPDSEVSRLVSDRDGVDLMPEQRTRPANKYLQPGRQSSCGDPEAFNLAELADPTPTGILGWIDRNLSRV